MGSLIVFIKLLVKGVIVWGIGARIWLEMTGHAFFDVLLFVMNYDMRKKRVIKWFKKLIK